jgi:hypothetical protein
MPMGYWVNRAKDDKANHGNSEWNADMNGSLTEVVRGEG